VEILNCAEIPGPRLLLGDFNEWTHGLASKSLGRLFESADIRLHLQRTRTYPGVIPFLHLDHIYYDQALELVSARLHRNRIALVASDHLPIVADFRFRH
jgi:endonuclease/exonuclease/phosphatase family metal-dependent hydrolase